jgi:hypothetical protein
MTSSVNTEPVLRNVSARPLQEEQRARNPVRQNRRWIRFDVGTRPFDVEAQVAAVRKLTDAQARERGA